MRIHSDKITARDIGNAAHRARVGLDTLAEHGSRSRKRAFNVNLTGSSRRHPGHSSATLDSHAATWDQWGIFLRYLFAIDPNATCYAYNGLDDFDHKTGTRFAYLTLADSHGDHTFRYSGTAGQQECTKCEAVRRWEV